MKVVEFGSPNLLKYKMRDNQWSNNTLHDVRINEKSYFGGRNEKLSQPCESFLSLLHELPTLLFKLAQMLPRFRERGP